MARRIEEGGIYRHFKGNFYEVLYYNAYDATNHMPSDRKLVVYKDLADNKIYVRDYEEFASKVDKRKYPEATQYWRFERVNVNKALKKLLGTNDILKRD